MDYNDILKAVDDVPEYTSFLTVDELKENARQLSQSYPDTVELKTIGTSRAGDEIEVVKIGDGAKAALIFAMPHPNEPIGSVMLDYLTHRLASDSAFREAMDYTWYCVKCVDPDGTRLNEGWFKGPFTITNYAKNYYRPPSHLQVEWTFPVEYKDLVFSTPMPETQGLMNLIEEIKPDFIFSLHNAGFGGVYYYISDNNNELQNSYYDLVDKIGLPLHLGEPEAPWMTKFADAVFLTPTISQMYDFMDAQGVDAGKAISGGTCSWDYAARFCDPVSLLCEMPYFHNDAVHDTTPADVTRRDAIMQAYDRIEEQFTVIPEIFNSVSDELTAPSPFKDAIASFMNVIPANITAMKNWAQSAEETEQPATNAEVFDSAYVKRFYFVFLNLGMVVRMIKLQIDESGETPGLASALTKAETAFHTIAEELEREMAYSTIPIKNLVQVQLGSALITASYAENR